LPTEKETHIPSIEAHIPTKKKPANRRAFFRTGLEAQAYRFNGIENCASGAMLEGSARWHQSCSRADNCSDGSVER